VLVVGVDENGLGPRLGPLIATAITLEVACYERAPLRRLGARVGITDSKQTSGFGQMAAAEGLALALLETLHGRAPADMDELLDLVSIDDLGALRSPCPAAAFAQCWSHDVRLPTFGGDIARGRKQLARLAKHGVRCVAARSTVACAGVVNSEMRRLGSRTTVDLSLFERLVLEARANAAIDLEIVLGMVGGIRDYTRYFDRLQSYEVSPLGRTRLATAYQVEGIGRLSFEIDADARHLPVGLASMLGKYVRELCMERQNRFYTQHQADLPRPSGYYDPVTRRFIAESRALRTRLAIVDACFER
jgi:ribonuclease HII